MEKKNKQKRKNRTQFTYNIDEIHKLACPVQCGGCYVWYDLRSGTCPICESIEILGDR